MTVFDYAVLGVIAGSLVLGLWRGVVSELLALAAWVAAIFVARQFAPDVAILFAKLVPEGPMRYVAGFATIFIAVLVVFAIARQLLSLLLRVVGLGLLDRLLGAVFGVARGVLIAAVAVLLGGLTPLPKEVWWREATLAPPLETLVIAVKPQLPADVAKRIRYSYR